MNYSYHFTTERLIADDWCKHNAKEDNASELDLATIVKNILTPNVTASLPTPWQGDYNVERAKNWIEERNSEGATLLVLDNISMQPAGLVILFHEDSENIRLGYMLSEAYWGKGLASELIAGLVHWFKENRIRSVIGGVKRDNAASRRVLEKNGFTLVTDTEYAEEQLFQLNLP